MGRQCCGQRGGVDREKKGLSERDESKARKSLIQLALAAANCLLIPGSAACHDAKLSISYSSVYY